MNTVVGFQSDIGDEMDSGQMDQRIGRRSGPEYRRRHRPAGRVGGTHCRRQKRWTWGHGRGARITNLNAFARLVTATIALAASAASAATISGLTLVPVGNPGNSGNPANNNLGAVSYAFQIAQNETTNAQYAAFLNAADPSGANVTGIYNTSMTSDPLGGINFNAGATSGSKYSVKSGSENRPVNFVSWNSAARFVNFYTTGGQTTETGSYDMTNLAAGRLQTALYVLPSADEWYKAAFYTGSGSVYTQYQTNSNTTPNFSGAASAVANTANFGATGATPAATGPLDVGSFANTTSAYGVFDMLGNVNEMTDNLSGTQFQVYGGSYAASTGMLSSFDALAAPTFRPLSGTTPSLGFRVAAVPEPGTIGLAVVGGIAMLGGGWMKRRRSGRRDRDAVVAA